MGKKLLNRKGFTLFEILIALAIVVVLMAVSVPMVSGVSKKLKMKEMDNYAKTIYLEAQNLLLEKKAEGSLVSFYEKIQELDEAEGRNLTEEPQDYEGTGDGWGSLYYLNADDLLSKEIIPVGSSFDGNFIIELNPMTGDVYGVFYREGSEAIDYAEEIQQLSGRSLADRQAAGLGYYGGGSVDAEEVVQEYITLDQRVSVVNDEELYVVISYKYSTVLQKDFLNDAFVIQMQLKGVESGTEAEIKIGKEKRGTNSKVIGNRVEVYVLLDSLIPGYSFNDIIVNNSETEYLTSDKEFIPGENLEIKVKATFNNGAYFQAEDAKVTTNALFSGKSGNEIYIGSLRHLIHLDGAYYEHEGGSAPVISMLRDIDFYTDDFVWRKEGESKVVYDPEAALSLRPAALQAFKPLKNASVFEAEGAEFKGMKLSNFIIDTGVYPVAENKNAGIIQTVSKMKISNVQLIDIKVKGGSASNVGALAGTVTDSEITNCGVYLTTRNAQKSYYADMEPTEVGPVNMMDQRYNTYTISGTNSVGGFCGSANDTKFNQCYAAIKVSGTYNVGGFCGTVTGNSEFSGCYASGAVTATQYVGGFVGSSDNSTYYNSYSTAEIMASNAAGGFVGVSTNSKYRECTSYAMLTTDPTGLSVPSASGVFYKRDGAGEDTHNEFTNCKYLNQAGYNAGLVDAVGITACAYGELRVDPKNSPESTSGYSKKLSEAIFPFKLVTGHHYGNWQVQFTIDTSLVYYEVYEGDIYGYYCVTTVSDEDGDEKEEFTWVLNTLQDEVCIEDGYALFTTYYLESFDYLLYIGSDGDEQGGTLIVYDPNEEEEPERKDDILPAEYKRQQSALEFKGYEGKYGPETNFDKLTAADTFRVTGMYLYQLPYELQTTDRSYVENFYDKLIIYNGLAKGSKQMAEEEGIEPVPVIGEAEYDPAVPTTGLTFYYCPHFAKNAVNPGILNGMILNQDIWNEDNLLFNPDKVFIRSAKQLNALGRYSYYWNTAGGNGYKDEVLSEEEGRTVKKKINFVQETDISFSAYVKEYCGRDFDLMDTEDESEDSVRNRPIGKSLDQKEKQFNNNYDGSCKKIIDYCVVTDERYAGLFGEVEDSEIKNVIMTVSEPGAGYIYSVFNGYDEDIAGVPSNLWELLWELFLRLLASIFEYFNYFNVETTAVGGLVGLSYHTGNNIYNCSVSGYEVKYIGAANPDVQGICVGGLVGISMSPITNCAATNDVRVELNGKYTKSISMGGLVGSAYYSATTNSYSGGTIDISLNGSARAKNIAALGIGGISGGVIKTWNEADVAAREDGRSTDFKTKFKSVYSYTRILVDKDDFEAGGKVGSEQRSNSRNSTGMFVAPVVVQKVLFNSYTSGDKTFGPVINASDISCNEECLYLDYTSEGMEMYYEEGLNNYSNLFGAQACTYEELTNYSFSSSEMGRVEERYTFPIDEDLQTLGYPFKSAVTTVVNLLDETPVLKRVHYGDWPLELVGGTRYASEYLAYYEKYTESLIGYYFIDENENVRNTLRNDGFGPNAAGYVLLKSKKDNSKTHEVVIRINGVDYYGYKYTDSTLTPGTSNNNKSYTWTYSTVREVGGVQYPGGSVSKTLYVNSNFGAAISLTDDLGKNATNPFQIRNATQFSNINGKNYNDAYFSQTTSINMSSVTTSVSILVPEDRRGNDLGVWTYDGGKAQGYVMSGAKAALFDTNEGTIQNVYSKDSTARFINTNTNTVKNCVVEGTEASIVLFANKNSGIITDCHVTNSELKSSGSASAGFAHTNSGTIQNCYLSFTMPTAMENVVAGFVHTNGGTIRNCHMGEDAARTIITSNGSVIAGFVYTNNEVIENCYVSNADLAANGSSVAGFVYSNKDRITGCYLSDVTMEATNNSVAGFVYTNEGTVTYCEVIAPGQTSPIIIQGSNVAGFVYINKGTGTIDNCGVYPTRNNDAYQNVSLIGVDKAVGFVMSNEYVLDGWSNRGGKITNSFFVGYISGKNGAAGFAGANKGFSTSEENRKTYIKQCYVNAHVVSDSGKAHGFIESNEGPIYSCYFTGWIKSKNEAYGFGKNGSNSYAEMRYCYSVFSFEKMDNSVSVTIYGFTNPSSGRRDYSVVNECYFGLANTVTVENNGRGNQAPLNIMAAEEEHGDLKQGNKPSQPFNTDLGQDYPYPEVPSLGHRGDWFTP